MTAERLAYMRGMRDAASLFAPEVIDVYDELIPAERRHELLGGMIPPPSSPNEDALSGRSTGHTGALGVDVASDTQVGG